MKQKARQLQVECNASTAQLGSISGKLSKGVRIVVKGRSMQASSLNGMTVHLPVFTGLAICHMDSDGDRGKQRHIRQCWRYCTPLRLTMSKHTADSGMSWTAMMGWSCEFF